MGTRSPVVTIQMEISDEIYGEIRKLVYSNSRINLGPDKKLLVSTRLNKRIGQLGFNSFDQYWSFVRSGKVGEETAFIIDSLTTNYTKFFREAKTIDFLKDTILPRWKRTGSSPFRLWCCASSTGEEPYSLAITLSEHFGIDNLGAWQIHASDISEKVLAVANAAIYEASRVQLPIPQWKSRYFQKGSGQQEGNFRVKKFLRNNVQFMRINLFQPNYPFNEPFDAIFCRNVMIYFDRDCQKQLVERLAEYIKPGGYLLIGSSESITGLSPRLRSVVPTAYRKE